VTIFGSTPQLSPETAEQLKAAVAGLGDWLIETRRDYHSRPEIGWREIETTRTIAEELERLGYTVTSGAEFLGKAQRFAMSDDPIPGEGDTGCIGVFETGRPGPTVCLRVDIDALPIEEATGNHAPAAGGWISKKPGTMHACGHDGHIAMGLGVARVIRPLLEQMGGTVKLLFQPAEEGGRGGYAVREAGWVDDVDFLTAVHLGLGLPTGTLATDVYGFLATRKYRVRYTGRPAHAGAAPEEGRNALIGACQAVLGLHALAQSSRPAIRLNVGTMVAGRSLNIVADIARFDFEMRAVEAPDLDALETRCLRLVNGTAQAHELEADFTPRGFADAWTNSAGCSDWAAAVNEAVGAFPRTIGRFDFRAGEDVTNLARRVEERGGEAAIYVVGADLADGHHTSHFDFDEDVLPRAVLFLSAALVSALSAPARAR
jgi:aminobenzoyl-glutamate utilization protein A